MTDQPKRLTHKESDTTFGSGGNNLYTLDLSTGLATTVGSTGFTSSGDIAFDSLGNLYMTASGPGTDLLISVNPLTGSGALIGNIGFDDVFGLNFTGSSLYGFTLAGSTISIDTKTGLGTLLSINNIPAFGADGAGGVTPVSEPASSLLFICGLLFILYYSRYKQWKKGNLRFSCSKFGGRYLPSGEYQQRRLLAT